MGSLIYQSCIDKTILKKTHKLISDENNLQTKYYTYFFILYIINRLVSSSSLSAHLISIPNPERRDLSSAVHEHIASHFFSVFIDYSVFLFLAVTVCRDDKMCR